MDLVQNVKRSLITSTFQSVWIPIVSMFASKMFIWFSWLTFHDSMKKEAEIQGTVPLWNSWNGRAQRETAARKKREKKTFSNSQKGQIATCDIA